MEARIKWVDNAAFTGETGSGHQVVIDDPPDIGGKNLGPRPMELMLLAIGSCSAVDVLHILKKGRQPVSDVQVDVQGERADADPKVFTRIHLKFRVAGKGLGASQVERAVKLSADKYCSASIMAARSGAAVTHEFELLDA